MWGAQGVGLKTEYCVACLQRLNEIGSEKSRSRTVGPLDVLLL